MSKSEKGHKKILVRNASVPVRPKDVKEIQRRKKKESTSEEESEKPEQYNDLQAPDFCTVLRLAEQIDRVRKECYGKNREDPVKSRNLNFQPDEKIYQDLIDLDLNDNPNQGRVKSQSSTHSLIKKDPEPDFNKMLKYNLHPEYVFSTSITPEIKKKASEFNGHSIYNQLRKWKS